MSKGVVGLAVPICMVFILLSPVCLYAKGMYVRDWIVITLRSSPNESSQAVGTASTNDLVEVLEEQGDGWSRIMNRDGVEGWVPGRFLSTQPPKTFFVKQMEDRIKALQDENMRLMGLTSGRTTSGVIPSEVQKRMVIPAEIAFSNCIGLKQGYDKMLRDFQDCSRKEDALASENNRMKTSDRLIFTFIGGMFIVIGIVIGLFIQMVRGRPKKQGYRF